jgi:hypothetical protein
MFIKNFKVIIFECDQKARGFDPNNPLQTNLMFAGKGNNPRVMEHLKVLLHMSRLPPYMQTSDWA